MTKRIVHGLALTKIAAVDFPCQEPAVVAIVKRNATAFDALLKGKYSADDRRDMASKGEAMSDGSYPIKDADDLGKAIHAVGRGKNNSHASIRTHIITRAKALGLSDKIPDDWKDGAKIGKGICDAITKAGIILSDPDGDVGARGFDEVLGAQQLSQQFWDAFYKGTNSLQESLASIVNDDTVDDKAAMIDESLKEFAAYIGEILPGEVGKALAAGVAATIAGGTRQQATGDNMSAITKALGLPDDATEPQILKAIADKEEAKAKAEKEAKVAKMSDKHTAFMNHADAKMPKGGKEAFQNMEPAERDAHIDANPLEDEDEAVEKALKAGDAFKTPDGIVVMKRKVGETVFAVLKAQNIRVIEQGKELAKAADEKIAKQFEDKAVELGFAKAFAPTIRKAYSGDADAQALLEKEMKALRNQAEAGGVFKELGGHSPNAGSAEAELLAKAAELKKSQPDLSNEQAYARVYKSRDNKELVARFKREQQGQA